MARSEDISSYVPRLIARRYAANPTPIERAEGQPLRATVLFADISGFTALSEKLAAKGPIGAEHLVEVLNQYFGELIDIVMTHGGDIVKFAGDALLALWYDDDLGTGVVRAAECAQEAQEELQDYADLAETPLSLKIGIAAGQVFTAQVGGVFERWELLVTGEPVVAAGLASDAVAPGSVVLAESAQTHAKGRVRCEALAEGCGRLLQVNDPTGVWPSPQPRLSDAAEECLRRYLPGAIKSRIEAGQSAWLAELRRITVVFVNLPEWKTMPRLELVTAAVRSIQECMYRYRGSLNKLSVDEKGISALGVFGLPPVANEDDPERGVRAALELVTTLQEQHIECRIGVATGRAFCGLVGNQRRREYTTIGDVVNTAARLMIAASQYATEDAPPLLCDRATHQEAASHLAFLSHGSMAAKGKSEGIAIFQPVGESSSVIEDTPLASGSVGRNAELAQISAALGQLTAGVSGCLVIEGEAGIGKSHLVSQLRKLAGEQQVTVLTGGGNAIEQATAYHGWRGIFGQLFDVGLMVNPEHKRLHLLSLLEDEDEWLEHAPLLNPVLAVNLPETETSQALRGQARADRSRSFLLDLLKDSVARSPKVVVLEDAHWLDSASWALAGELRGQVDPLLLVVCVRPGEVSLAEDMANALRAHTPQRLQLTPLSHEDIARMLCTRLGVAEIPRSILAPLQEQAEGNPHFAEALILALREAGTLRIEAGKAVAELEGTAAIPAFPDTLQGAVAAQIDQLEPDQQLTLKVASVIGRVIPSTLLSAVFPSPVEDSELLARLDGLVDRQLTRVEATAPERVDSFRHSIVQQATYDLMAYAQRREIHQQVAQWYESSFGAPQSEPEPPSLNEHVGAAGHPAGAGHSSDLAPYFPLLAHHYFNAGDRNRARTYAHLAGRQAADEHSLAEALVQFQRALELTDDADARTRFAIRISQEQVLEVQGNRDEQKQVLRELFELATTLGDAEQMASVHLRWGRFHDMTGGYAKALNDAARAESLARQCQNHELMLQARITRAQALSHSGQHAAAREGYTTTLALAREHDLPGIESECLRGIAVVSTVTGNLEEAEASAKRALHICIQRKDLRGAAAAHTMLGILARHQYRLQQAVEYFNQSIDSQRRIGYRLGENIALVNLASVYVELGQFERAAEVIERVLQLSEQINDARGRSFGLSLQALIRIRRDGGEQALELAKQALDCAEDINDNESRSIALTRIGHSALICEDYAQAEQHYREAEAMRIATGQETRAAEARAGLVRCLIKTERVDEAYSLSQVLRRQFAEENLEGSYDAVRIGLACVEAAKAKGVDEGPVLVACLDFFQRVMASISDPQLRESFRSNVPSNVELLERCRALGLLEASTSDTSTD